MHPQFRSGAGVDLPRVAHSPMVPPLVGGVPVDYGPRLVENRQPPTIFPSKFLPHNTNDEENAPSRLLWVGNISGDTSEALLTQVFEKYGKVDTVSVYPQRSYAFVEFKALENSKAAKAGLQGKAVKGQPLRIEFAKPAKPSRHLWIWGAHETITKEHLETEFKNFGSLEDFKILREGKCALVVYKRLEDAISAKEGFNKKIVGGRLRVDFLRSQPLKRGNTAAEVKPQNVVIEEVGRREAVPTETLWISFPSTVRVDEERLRRAFILFGEVERIKIFPDRNYCFVQFRNADEASRAREGLQGRLFNDPRVQIQFSNNEGSSLGADRSDGSFLSPLHGREAWLHPGLSGLRATLGASERFGPSSPRRTMNLPGQSSILHHDMRGSGSMLGLGRQGGVVPTSGFVSKPFVRGGLADARFPFEGANVHIDNRVAMPMANFGNMNETLPAWPMGDSRAMPDMDNTQRENKRPKVGISSALGLLGRASLIDGHVLSRDVHENIQRYGKAGNEELQIQPLRPHSGPSHVDGAQSGIGVLGPGFGILGPGVTRPIPNSGSIDQTRGQDLTDAKWRWRGSIAKAGTFVCRAQSFAVGKGIDIELPEVVNCAARTTLDMLAQHLQQVVDYGVIVFVPDGDSETSSYQDFVHYLGDKHRAGVANLGEKITLFLVPPSHFSEKVLKLPGECLFGVIIKTPQVGSGNYYHQQVTMPQEQVHLQQLTQTPFKPIMQDSFVGNLKPPFTSSGDLLTPLSQSTSAPQTSDLIASLTSLLPAQRQSPNEFPGVLRVSDAGSRIPGIATQIGQPEAAQSRGVAQAENRPAVKGIEISHSNQMPPPQLPGSGPVSTLGLANLISRPSQMLHQQPTSTLPNLIPHADPQKYVAQVSGVFDATAGLSGMHGLHAKDLNQSATLQSQQSQVLTVQHQAQDVQQQITGIPQLHPQSTLQGGQSESNISGQLSLGQFLQNNDSNGMVSTQSTAVGQIAEADLPQVGGSVGNERQNRFQATLQLAAALLQRMQNTSRSQETPSQ